MDCSELLVRDADVEGTRVDVQIGGGIVTAIGSGLDAPPHVRVVDADGGALLPGLHDHHLHLLATAAALSSVDCGPAVGDPDGLAAALRAAAGAGWVRGVGYHEVVAGPLDRTVLDAMVPDRPVRVQHRSGALWVLNSAAIAQVALDGSPDVERDTSGRPTGRLWRYDARLRAALPADATLTTDLAEVGRVLLAHGVTSVTDATPDLDNEALTTLLTAHRNGSLPHGILLLGAADGATLPDGWAVGPRKLLLRDHDLPSLPDLTATIRAQHDRGRPVAVHCVSAESLVLTVAALEDCGPLPGDRVEHAAVVLPGIGAALADLGVAVVSQPDFVRGRGEEYLTDVQPGELPFLHPYRSLLEAGVAVAPSSDAPYAAPDPWRTIASARDRITAAGRPIGPGEAVPAQTPLAGFLSPAAAPGVGSRRVEVGAPADLCLLDTPLDRALQEAPRVPVRAAFVRGRLHAFDNGHPMAPEGSRA